LECSNRQLILTLVDIAAAFFELFDF